MSLDCKKCHICDTPTKANPCLVICPRNNIEVERHSPEEGPENIIINKVIADPDLYGPSSFSHKLHAEMSLMSGGCAICHHFNPPGKIVNCSSCHENKRERADLSKPDLKAAFHRQCMGCHQTWEEKTECASCHSLNTKEAKVETKPYIEKAHPPISIPKKIIYETESDEGSIVTFFHNDHSSLFDLSFICTAPLPILPGERGHSTAVGLEIGKNTNGQGEMGPQGGRSGDSTTASADPLAWFSNRIQTFSAGTCSRILGFKEKGAGNYRHRGRVLRYLPLPDRRLYPLVQFPHRTWIDFSTDYPIIPSCSYSD